jgi:16S rRNA (adenine1518-N6/adenine1519-N6)-dimethyltransferase
LTEAHHARKRFGQNFLIDRACIRRIVAAIEPNETQTLVEIGPGLGALTEALLAHVSRLDAVEIDRDLAAILIEKYARSGLRIHIGDALTFDYASLGEPLRIVGNLPYNISSPLLFRFSDCAERLTDVHVMLQKEVVDRMIAVPGSSQYGRLSVMLGYHFHIERLFRIGPGAFRPQPKVESAFARLRPKAATQKTARDPVLFATIVRNAFGQRRKTLRNALAGIVDESVMRASGIDPQARGETLSVDDFVGLANCAAGQ